LTAVRYAYTSLFDRSYRALTAAQQKRIDTALTKFARHPFHPFPKGLRVHKLAGIQGTAEKPNDPPPDVWEMHASGALLITFQVGKDLVIFRNCGQHDAVLKSP
jgi:mRNA-degrading endonuclease YafQ of YafQ-DinJ toxin-antitoxin module